MFRAVLGIENRAPCKLLHAGRGGGFYSRRPTPANRMHAADAQASNQQRMQRLPEESNCWNCEPSLLLNVQYS